MSQESAREQRIDTAAPSRSPTPTSSVRAPHILPAGHHGAGLGATRDRRSSCRVYKACFLFQACYAADSSLIHDWIGCTCVYGTICLFLARSPTTMKYLRGTAVTPSMYGSIDQFLVKGTPFSFSTKLDMPSLLERLLSQVVHATDSLFQQIARPSASRRFWCALEHAANYLIR